MRTYWRRDPCVLRQSCWRLDVVLVWFGLIELMWWLFVLELLVLVVDVEERDQVQRKSYLCCLAGWQAGKLARVNSM